MSEPDHGADAGRAPLKGRGAVSNRTGRFERLTVDPFDDGWGTIEDRPANVRTELHAEDTRKIITRNDSPDVPFFQSINPYKGCEHGCVYCFARPTHAYLGLSPGLDFETKIFHKPKAAELLRKELSKPGYEPAVIALGANTDPYQPAERKLGITRAVLEVMAEFNHPVNIVSKSNLVLRDLDLLAPMAEKGLASVLVSITTLDRELAGKMEPRAATPSRRLEAVRTLSDSGVPVGVLTSPMVPGLNDHEVDALLEAARSAGAEYANYVLLRLPLEIKDLFHEWLEEHYPHRAARVLSLMRQSHGGRLYESQFGRRMRGEGPYAEVLERRFELACKRLGLRRKFPERRTDLFRVPPRSGDQRSLFG